MQVTDTLIEIPEPWVVYDTWTRVGDLWCCGAWACHVSQGYSVLFGTWLRVLSCTRHDGARDPERWAVMLSAKNALLGDDAWAYECYPQASQVLDTAHVYHLIECPIDCSFAALQGTLALFAVRKGS